MTTTRIANILSAISLLALLLIMTACATPAVPTLPGQPRATRTPRPTRTPVVPTPTETLGPREFEIDSQPYWRCATPTPQPTTCANNSCSPIVYATPYSLLNDFPPGGHVQVGSIGRAEIGVWGSIDNVQMFLTFADPEEFEGQAWIVTWDVTIINASTTQQYEFAPYLVSYISEVRMADGSLLADTWAVDPNAADELDETDPFLELIVSDMDFPQLEPFYEENLEDETEQEVIYLQPGQQMTTKLASYVPGPQVTKIGYTFSLIGDGDPMDIDYPGDNQANWRTTRNTDDQLCPGEVTPGPEGFDAIPLLSGDPGDVVLARFPVDGGRITRSYGCVTQFTGIRGSSCPTSAPWFHNGIDISVAAGSAYYDTTGVTAIANYAGTDDDGSDCSDIPGADDPPTGLGIFIEHTAYLFGHTVTVYGGHLSDLNVRSNGAIRPEQVLGATGSTGCSTAPHLHFSVIVDGLYVDPMKVLP